MRPGEAFGDGCEIIVCDGMLNHPGPHYWLDSGRHHFLPLDDDTAVERLRLLIPYLIVNRKMDTDWLVGAALVILREGGQRE